MGIGIGSGVKATQCRRNIGRKSLFGIFLRMRDCIVCITSRTVVGGSGWKRRVSWATEVRLAQRDKTSRRWAGRTGRKRRRTAVYRSFLYGRGSSYDFLFWIMPASRKNKLITSDGSLWPSWSIEFISVAYPVKLSSLRKLWWIKRTYDRICLCVIRVGHVYKLWPKYICDQSFASTVFHFFKEGEISRKRSFRMTVTYKITNSCFPLDAEQKQVALIFVINKIIPISKSTQVNLNIS